MILTPRWKKPMELSLRGALTITVFVSIRLSEAASGEAPTANRPGVQVFASADDGSPIIELNPAGNTLSPVAEMTGAGGLKWFMVKTKNGNVGWIKAGDDTQARKIDDHFRTLPKDAVTITPASNTSPSGSPVPAATTSAKDAITIPVRIERGKVLVPVTLISGSNSSTAVLVVDTGASQTLISKRLAMDLRLRSVDTRTSEAVAALVVADAGHVESVKVGDAEVKNMRVSIHDGSNSHGGQGLLGFDFLGRFRMSIDAEKKIMVLTPRQ